MDFEKQLSEKGILIEKTLEELIPEQCVPYNILLKAARYSLLGSGKRLRPLLALATAEACGAVISKSIKPACSLELIHTYSLIHDDLPCMDDDDFRRGKPSLHKAFPEGQAVLTGDFLLTYAFEILAIDENLNDYQKINLVRILSQHAGAKGMIGGQVMDLEAEGQTLDISKIKTIHQHKTGALIIASIEFGSIIAEMPNEIHQSLIQFGENLGLAFQIIDDILDVTASKKKHGKDIASDITNRKTTFVTLLGLEKSQKFANELLESSKKILDALPIETKMLKYLAERLVYRNE